MTHPPAIFRPYSTFSAQANRPSLGSRASMIDYLIRHPRHDEGNGFGTAKFRFAQNVKLNHGEGILDNIPFAERDAALEVVSELQESGSPFLYDTLFEDFERSTGASVGFGGRSGGWIVLLDEYAADLSPAELATPGTITTAELRSLCKRVMAFDALCDNVVANFQAEVEAYMKRPAPPFAEGDHLILPALSEFQGLVLSDDLIVTVTKVEPTAYDTLYSLEYIGVDDIFYAVTAYGDQLESAEYAPDLLNAQE